MNENIEDIIAEYDDFVKSFNYDFNKARKQMSVIKLNKFSNKFRRGNRKSLNKCKKELNRVKDSKEKKDINKVIIEMINEYIDGNKFLMDEYKEAYKIIKDEDLSKKVSKKFDKLEKENKNLNKLSYAYKNPKTLKGKLTFANEIVKSFTKRAAAVALATTIIAGTGTALIGNKVNASKDNKSNFFQTVTQYKDNVIKDMDNCAKVELEPLIKEGKNNIFTYAYGSNDNATKNLLNEYGSNTIDCVITASCTINKDGVLEKTHNNIPTNTINYMKDNGKKSLMMINNFDKVGWDASTQLAHELFTNADKKQKFINDTLSLVKKNGYSGINIDFENLAGNDRENFTSFMKELKDKIGSKGYYITASIQAKFGEGMQQALDYKEIGKCDGVFVMNYDYHVGGSNPGGNSIGETKNVIDYICKTVRPEDRHKFMLGMATSYGRMWIKNNKGGYSKKGKAITMEEIESIAKGKKLTSKWDGKDGVPYYEYENKNKSGKKIGTTTIVFEDEKSLKLKNDYAKEKGLGGVCAWVLEQTGKEGKNFIINNGKEKGTITIKNNTYEYTR